jgi:bifunctional oligoribonuclease and PAP phosphatase NrnA
MNSDVETSIRKASEALKKADSIVIAVHVQPDGDALGSMLSMMQFLKSIGKDVCMTWGDKIEIPSQYQWMPFIDKVTTFENCEAQNRCNKSALLLTLDCASEHRLGLMEKYLPDFGAVINVDHHIDNTKFGSINVLDFKAAATCEIIYNVLIDLKAGLTADIANCLYAGIVTDTGKFQYTNTGAGTLRIAANLIDSGAEPNMIFHHIYENITFGGLKLMARVIERAKIMEDSKLAYSYIKLNDLSECGITMAETETFIDQLRTAKEADAAVILKETADAKLRASLRSKGYIDIGAIAREVGGGGHRNASGATFEATIDKVDETAKWISDRIVSQKAASLAG